MKGSWSRMSHLTLTPQSGSQLPVTGYLAPPARHRVHLCLHSPLHGGMAGQQPHLTQYTTPMQ